MILIDTSVWIDYLRGVRNVHTARLWALLSDDSAICTTGIIIAEILAGEPKGKLKRRIQQDLGDLFCLSANDPMDYIAASEIYYNCRAMGLTVRSLTDCLIAAVAIRHDATLFYKDRHFDAIKQAAPHLKTIL